MKYTVVGYWYEDSEPWVRHVEADCPLDAAEVAAAEEEDGALIIIEVFEGHLQGQLYNRVCTTRDNLEVDCLS